MGISTRFPQQMYVKLDPCDKPCLSPHLTQRECDVLLGITQGLAHMALAKQLHIAGSTVAQHIEAVRRKLGAKNRPEMVGRAFVLGLIRIDTWPPKLSGHGCILGDAILALDKAGCEPRS